MSYSDLKNFFDVINDCNPGFEGEFIVINLPNEASGKEKEKAIRDAFGFEVVPYNGHKRLTIRAKSPTYRFYFDPIHFWQAIYVLRQGFSDYVSDIGILNFSGKRFYYDNAQHRTYSNEIENSEENFFSNIHSYLLFLNFLEEKSLGDELKFRFVDDFNWSDRQVFFSSLKKEGRLAFEISRKLPDFPSQDLSVNFDNLSTVFTETDKQMYHPKFVKAEIIDRFSKPVYERLSADLLFIEIGDVVAVANQNLDIFMADLSIDKIKKDFLELKTKYFGQFREIVSKLSTQIIALPISISATAIATYNTREINGVAWFVLFAFLVYSVFASYLLRSYREDLEDIDESLDRDYSKELNQQYLRKESEDYKFFHHQQMTLQYKIKTLKRMLYFYFGLQSIGHAFVIWIVLNTLCFSSLFSSSVVLIFFLTSLFSSKMKVTFSFTHNSI